MQDAAHRLESKVRSASEFRGIVDQLPLGVAVFRGQALLYANPALLLALSYGPRGEPPPLRVDQLVSSETWGEIEPRLQAVASGAEPVLRCEGRLRSADGKLVDLDLSLLGVVFEGEPALLLVSSAPLDARSDPARALADRMASLGRLAAGVAHEINNPLAYVLGSLELGIQQLGRLGERLGPGLSPPELLELENALANAHEGAERMRAVVKDLVAFSRSSPESRELVDVEAVLDSMVKLAWNEIRHRARVVKSYASVPPVLADPARLGQVFLNLLLNAAQAMERRAPDGGEIRLSTRSEAGRVVVEVHDSGVGIEPQNLERIFDPFFTTKPLGYGTGLGLAICQSIVRGLDGEIGVRSEPDRGSMFFVALPAAPPDTELPEAAPAQSGTSPVRQSRMLVVDDEPLLGQTLRFAFQGRHQVDVVASGREALAQLAKDSAYDLILCDLMMPDVSGSAVYEAVVRSHPELVPRFVFMTGGAFTERAQEFLARYRGVHLEKPFNIDEVERLLAEPNRQR